MRELNAHEVDAVSGAGIRLGGVCFKDDAAYAAIGFIVGWVKGALEQKLDEPKDSGDPWK